MPKQYFKNQRGVTTTNTKTDLVNSKKGQLKKISHYRKRCHVRYITPQKKMSRGTKNTHM
jgi:outer membrane biogenesis lipoprotein LolB